MRVIDLTPEDLGGGKYPTAFFIHRYFPGTDREDPKYYLGTSYSCMGLAIGPKRSWRVYLPTEGVYEHIKIVAYGSLGHGPHKSFGMMNDIRRLDMIQAGCCPPQILFDFMGTERIPT